MDTGGCWWVLVGNGDNWWVGTGVWILVGIIRYWWILVDTGGDWWSIKTDCDLVIPRKMRVTDEAFI